MERCILVEHMFLLVTCSFVLRKVYPLEGADETLPLWIRERVCFTLHLPPLPSMFTQHTRGAAFCMQGRCRPAQVLPGCPVWVREAS